jgi:hypothetical protein
MQVYPIPIVIEVTPRPEWVTPVPFTGDNVLGLAIACAVLLGYIILTVGSGIVGLRLTEGEWINRQYGWYMDCSDNLGVRLKKLLGWVLILADAFQLMFCLLCVMVFGV